MVSLCEDANSRTGVCTSLHPFSFGALISAAEASPDAVSSSEGARRTRNRPSSAQKIKSKQLPPKLPEAPIFSGASCCSAFHVSRTNESLLSLPPDPALLQMLSRVLRRVSTFQAPARSKHTLVLIRHGQSVWNLENKFTGWYDIELSPKGHEEAIAAGKLLRDEGFKFDKAYTSVLRRAIRTLWHS
jgi:hypothetical protein